MMMKSVEMGGHFSTHIDMCPSDTTLTEEDPYCMHKVMVVLYLYEYDGHIKPTFNVMFEFDLILEFLKLDFRKCNTFVKH